MFEKYLAEILTSCVIETTKANMKNAASKWALVLMNPEYVEKIPERFKKKIGEVGRNAYKGQKQEDDPELSTPCPFCNTDNLEYNLDCKSCNNVLPFCIASGK